MVAGGKGDAGEEEFRHALCVLYSNYVDHVFHVERALS
jgi:hypothetical protein